MIIQRLAKLLLPWDPPRGEVCLRVAVSSAFGVSLAVATIPWGFPKSTTFLMGVLVPVFSIAFPTLYFSILLIFPWLVCVFIIGMVFSTMLLAAATVSDGLFVGIFSVFTFMIMGMFFGDVQETTTIANFINAIAGAVAVTLRPLVQDGFSITMPAKDTQGDFFDLARLALEQACLANGQPEDCWTDSLPPDSTFSVTIPEDQSTMFGGRTVYVTPSDEGITVEAEGGLWIVGGLWSWKGIDNPFAFYRNFMIMLCWCAVCWTVAILVPTMTTGRSALSQMLVPAALMKATVADKAEEQTTDAHLWNTLDGSLAKVTIFEPRLLRAPLQALWPQLQDLIVKTRSVMDGSFLRVAHSQDPTVLKESDDIIKDCATALMQNSSKDRKTFLEKQAPTKVVIDNETQYLYNKCVDLRDATMSWFDALDHPPKTPPKEALKNVAAPAIGMVLMEVPLLQRMVKLGTLMFRPQKWNIRGILWAMKASFGFAALMCMQVYWDKWANFAIETGITDAGTVFSGWVFYAYAFAWRPTVEGTFKKGVQRTFGVLLGGFLGWLGVIVCSGFTNDDDADPNPYGLVVWITVFTVIGAYYGVEKGMAAHFGMNKDHGYVVAYYLETLTLIPMEVYIGAGHNNDVTANRIASCVVGVLMAIILTLIPPHVNAGDPKHIRGYLVSLKNEWKHVLQTMLSEDYKKLEAKEFPGELSEDLIKCRKDTLRVLKDADQFKPVDKVIPYFKINEGFKPLLGEMAITESLMADLLEMSVDFLAEEPKLISGGAARAELGIMLEGNTKTDVEGGSDTLNTQEDNTKEKAVVEAHEDAPEEKAVEGNDAQEDAPKEQTVGGDYAQEEGNTKEKMVVEGGGARCGRVSICVGLAGAISARLKEHEDKLEILSSSGNGGRGNGNGGRGGGDNKGHEDNHQVDEQNNKDAHLADAVAGLAVVEVDGHYLDNIGSSEASA